MDLKKQKQFKLSLMTTFKDIILSSTVHGIPNIIRSKNTFLKLMWTCFSLISGAACAYLISQTIVNYLKYEVNTKTRLYHEYKTVFPTVTICNANKFTSNLSEGFIMSYEQNLLSSNPLYRFAENRANFLSNLAKYEKWIDLFGDSLEKLIVNCEFKFNKCNKTNFKFFLHPFYGNCYQFNSGYNNKNQMVDTEYSITTEKRQGLRLILNISVPETIKFLNPSSGAIIFIHNQSLYPLMVSEVSASPNFETNIAFSRVYYESQEKPYSSCDSKANDINSHDSDIFKLVHANTKKYSQTLCVFQCFQKLVIENCNCFVTIFPSFFHLRNPCGDPIQMNCTNKIVKNFYEDNYLEKVCLKKCPLECDKEWFDLTISSNFYSNEKFEQALKNYNGSDETYFNKSINMEDLAVINLYYKDLNYLKITENPTIDLVGLISSIGGVGGLFLGISMLSLVEILEFLFQLFFNIMRHNKINV